MQYKYCILAHDMHSIHPHRASARRIPSCPAEFGRGRFRAVADAMHVLYTRSELGVSRRDPRDDRGSI